MTPTQRYLFDLQGYLHIPDVLTPEQLASGRAAIDRYIATPDEQLPEGFARSADGKNYENGFAFDKALESLVMHPVLWPIIREFTHDKPAFSRGTLLVDTHEHPPLKLHCAREDYGWQSTRYDTREGRIYCDDFVIFPYFDDVNRGDGGLIVIPGSHKAAFPRPASFCNDDALGTDAPLPHGIVNVTPKAGDVVIMTEMVAHGTLQWRPKDRMRRTLVLRYRPQFKGQPHALPESIRAQLWPETLELMASAHYTETKAIVQSDTVPLR